MRRKCKRLVWVLSQKWGCLEANQIIRDMQGGYRPECYKSELRLAFECRKTYCDFVARGYIEPVK